MEPYNAPLRSPCARCGHREGRFTLAGPHIKASCAGCGSYCYFAPKPPEEKTPPDGRRKPASAELTRIKELQEQFDQGQHETNGFLSSVLEQYQKWGGLTDRQWAALMRSR